jgi:hypothetical protein
MDQPAQYLDPFHQRLCGGRLDKRQRAGRTWRLQIQASVWSYGVSCFAVLRFRWVRFYVLNGGLVVLRRG